MKMLREVHRTVEPTLEAVVQWCDTQHKVLGNCVNDLGDMTVQLSKQLKKTNKRLNRIRIGAQLTNLGCLGVTVISLIHTHKLWDLEQQISKRAGKDPVRFTPLFSDEEMAVVKNLHESGMSVKEAYEEVMKND